MPAVAEVMQDIPEDGEGLRTELNPEAHESPPELGASPEPSAGTHPEGSQGSSKRRVPSFEHPVPTLRPACLYCACQAREPVES